MVNKKIFCIGVWDLFHVGHLSVIHEARQFGDLTVAVVCDEAVKRVKGEHKPVISENDRLKIIRNIKGVNNSYIVDDFSIDEDVIKWADYIILGGDQTHIKNVGLIPSDKLIRLVRPNDGNSTTAIMKKIKGEVNE